MPPWSFLLLYHGKKRGAQGFQTVASRGLKERRLDENKYLCMGGGFPIRIKNSAVVGTICVSAFKHFEDHQVIVDTLEKYFNQL